MCVCVSSSYSEVFECGFECVCVRVEPRPGRIECIVRPGTFGRGKRREGKGERIKEGRERNRDKRKEGRK